ncbi:MAG: signal peptidase II [Myxococcales bacterium]|nr:signal peptidase II [Myxococcales bacterium]
MARRYWIFALTAGLTLGLDQLTKIWARATLDGAKVLPLIDGFWEWRLSFNTGSAFGLFASLDAARVILSVVGVVACGAIIFAVVRLKDDQRWLTTALGLIAGGAIGNVVDRILFGKVTDFVVWRYLKHEWPAFNIADAALVAGVLIMLLDVGGDQKRHRQLAAAAENAKQ